MQLNRKILLVLLVFGMLNIAQGQVNLIPDPGFEDTIQCPNNSSVSFLSFWENPNTGGATPDFFHLCLNSSLGLCPGSSQLCSPYQGEGFIGIYVYADDAPNLREYIGTKLKSPLLNNKKYCISFYAKSSKYSYYYTSNIGVLFSNQKITSNSMASPNDLTNYVPSAINDSMFIDIVWTFINLEYIALGGEEYIIIGNFNYDFETNLTLSNLPDANLSQKTAYLFIDYVSVYECEEDSMPPPASDSSLHYKIPNVISPNSDGLNDAFVLESRGVKEVSVKVYNRWGEEVVSRKVSGISTDILNKTILWDATHKGQPAPQGVYYYLIELSTKNGEVIIEKGTVTVL